MGNVLGLRVAAMQKPLSPEGLRRGLERAVSVPVPQHFEHKNPTVTDLRLSLERGEIHCHYQPKVDMRTAIVRGVEVLARWRHPTLGMVSPSEFIPLAEQSGDILELTLRIVKEAMAQSAVWMAHGLHLINGLPDEILKLQESQALPSDKIVFELTESSLVSGSGVALGVMARIRSLVRASIARTREPARHPALGARDGRPAGRHFGGGGRGNHGGLAPVAGSRLCRGAGGI